MSWLTILGIGIGVAALIALGGVLYVLFEGEFIDEHEHVPPDKMKITDDPV